MDNQDVAARETTARAGLLARLGTREAERGVTLFVTHHLDELPESYWREHVGVTRPEPRQILDALVLRDAWASDDDDVIDTYDFTLPNDVTDYVLGVRIGPEGLIDSVTMES